MHSWASQEALVVKNLLPNIGDLRDRVSVPGSRESLGEGNGNPLQYSCLENPLDRGDWATVHSVAKSQTVLKWLSTHDHRIEGINFSISNLLWCMTKK